jgi:hypothetical protein
VHSSCEYSRQINISACVYISVVRQNLVDLSTAVKLQRKRGIVTTQHSMASCIQCFAERPLCHAVKCSRIPKRQHPAFTSATVQRSPDVLVSDVPANTIVVGIFRIICRLWCIEHCNCSFDTVPAIRVVQGTAYPLKQCTFEARTQFRALLSDTRH